MQLITIDLYTNKIKGIHHYIVIPHTDSYSGNSRTNLSLCQISYFHVSDLTTDVA